MRKGRKEQNQLQTQNSKRQKKKKKNTILFRITPVTMVLFILVASLVLGRFVQEYGRYRDLQSQAVACQHGLEETQQKKKNLEAEKNLYFNPSFMERMARENLGMIKNGETLILPMEEKDVPQLDENMDKKDVIH
ncbi:MAG: septum formation initiator family protein [Clostridiales bacterium]